MNFSWKKFGGPLLMIGSLVLVGVLWHELHRPKSVLVAEEKGGSKGKTTDSPYDFDRFQKDLANRVLQQYGAGADSENFSVVVATADYPVGTLYRPTAWVPADFDDCAPSPLPKMYPAGHLFPSYKLSSNTALTANLGPHAIQGLTGAGVNLQQAESVEYTIQNAQVQIMDDKSVDAVSSQGNCGKYIASHPGVRLIRGSITGQMTFTVKVDNPASVKAQLLKLGDITVNDDPQASTLSVSDNQNQQIVQLLSEFHVVQSKSDAAPIPKTVMAARPVEMKTVPAGAPTHIFVEQDKNDAADAGAKVVHLLHSAWPQANVESKVENIPTEKMPGTAQVRFFNAGDADLANKCLAIFKQTYPNAHAVRIGLPSPQGQIEVWLPKVKP